MQVTQTSTAPFQRGSWFKDTELETLLKNCAFARDPKQRYGKHERDLVRQRNNSATYSRIDIHNAAITATCQHEFN